MDEEERLAKQFGIDVSLLREFKRSTQEAIAPAVEPLDDPFADDFDDPIDFISGNLDFDKRMNAAFRLSNEQIFGACGE